MSDRTQRSYEEADAGARRQEPSLAYPQSVEAEMGLICSGMISPDVLEDAAAKIGREHFHIPAHADVWEQMVEMRREGLPIDIPTITNRLHERRLLEMCGGAGMVTNLITYLPTAANWEYYADILDDKRILREMIRVGNGFARRAFTEQSNVRDLVEEFVTTAVGLSAGRTEALSTIQHVKEFALKALTEIEYAYKNRGKTVGLPTGFPDLDRMIGGWQKSLTYYVGARPAMGKTSIGLNFAEETASASAAVNAPVLFFSLEMTGTQLAKRLIFTKAKVNQQRARDGMLSESKWDDLCRSAQSIASSLLELDETAALTIADFRARARAWIKKIRRTRGVRKDGKPDGLIVIDYLQRMKGSSKRSESARYLELQEIAQGISLTAKDLDVPIIILAQLKRPKDKKPESEPDMSEFRECGDIEQEAHVVALLHRPFYYVQHSLEKQQGLAEKIEERFKEEAKYRGQNADNITFGVEDLKRYAKLLIDKQREGPVGPIDLRFIGDYTLFESWDADRALYSNNRLERQVTEDAAAEAERAEGSRGGAESAEEEDEPETQGEMPL